MHRGYVKLWRKTFDAGLHRDHKLFTLWVWLLANVTHQPLRYLAGDRMLTLRPGQRVVARRALAEELGMSEKEVRTRLRKLERLGCVTLSRVGRLTLLSVTNWDRYQHGPGAAIAPAGVGSGTPDGAAGAACDAVMGPAPGHGPGRERAAKQTQDHTNTPEKGSCAAGAAPRPPLRPTSRPTGEPRSTPPDADGAPHKAGAASPCTAATAAPASLTGYEYTRGKRLTGRRLHWFERFWNAFADKRGKAGAARAFAALGTPGEELLERIERAAAEYARRRPALLAAGSTPKMAQGWLTDRRWEDELSDPRSELRAWAEDGAPEENASGPHSDDESHAPVDAARPERRAHARRRSGPQPHGFAPGVTYDAPERNIGYSKHQTRTTRPKAFPARTAPAAGGRTGGAR